MNQSDKPFHVKSVDEFVDDISKKLEESLSKKTINRQGNDVTDRELQEKIYLQQMQQVEMRVAIARAVKLEDDNASRRDFSRQIFAVTVVWMFLILLIVFHAGKGSLHFSDTVLVTLITTTTANVFGFMYIVVKYLFNEKNSS